MHHEMLEFITGAGVGAVPRRPGALVAGYIRATAPPGTIGQHGGVTGVTSQVDFSPMKFWVAALKVPCTRRGIINPAVCPVTADQRAAGMILGGFGICHRKYISGKGTAIIDGRRIIQSYAGFHWTRSRRAAP